MNEGDTHQVGSPKGTNTPSTPENFAITEKQMQKRCGMRTDRDRPNPICITLTLVESSYVDEVKWQQGR